MPQPIRLLALWAFFGLVLSATGDLWAADRQNVLFIAVDDLRPQLACYGKSFMKTPHFDRLASRGVLFERAYCMVPTCGASRAALMTSVRPARDRFTTHLTWAQDEARGMVPLNTQFKNSGYTTLSLGKVYHHPTDHADGWSEPAWRSRLPAYQDLEASEKDIAENKRRWPEKNRHRGAAYESFDGPEDNYPDADTTQRALGHLKKLAGSPDQPFFLAVGFSKPHLPFNAPKKYWDLYDREQIDLPANYHSPENAPEGAVHNSGELRAYAGIVPSGPVDRETARSLIHGYYACVSFIDAQVGRLLDELDALGIAENTVVVLWGDHGWQLGEHGMWNKHSCFETSMHAPLMVIPPRSAGINPGTRVSALVEFIDIYPSICELAGIESADHVQGTSFVPLMKDPSANWKSFAIGRFGAGDTIRTDQYRFSRYTDAKGKVTGRMIYDHESDPDENVNVVEQLPGKASRLQKRLKAKMGQPFDSAQKAD